MSCRSSRRRRTAGLAGTLAVLLITACDGPSHHLMLRPTMSCAAFLRAAPHALSDRQTVEALVRSILGTDNLGARAAATVDICIADSTGLGLGQVPVSSVIRQTLPTCAWWLSASHSARSALAETDLGSINLALRVKGTTAACMTDIASYEPVADTLKAIAAQYDLPVNIEPSKVPPTTDPTDPDKCNERTANTPGNGSTADYLTSGLADCVAMGY